MKPECTTERSFFHKTDWLAVALILLISLGLWGFWLLPHKAVPLQIEIYSDNQLLETIALPAEDRTIPIPGKAITLELRDNAIRFSETDCPDKTCSRTGFIGQNGQTAICLPNRVVVKLVGSTPPVSETDGIAG